MSSSPRTHPRRPVILTIVLALVTGALSVLTVAGSPPAEASHNRASQIQWNHGGATGQVEFTVNFVARASYYSGLSVGSTFTDPYLDFGDGNGTSPEFTVLDVDEKHDVLYAKAANVLHTFDGDGPYTATLSSCCRLSSPEHINNPDGDYLITSTVNLALADNSPTSTFAPVATCHTDDLCYFRVTARDPDGRQLRWRLATSAEAGGNFVQPGQPNAVHDASVNATTGLYSWDTHGATLNPSGDTYYSTQVVVESLQGGEVASSVAVDFFIRLSEDAGSVSCLDTDGDDNPDNDGDGLCDNWEDSGVPVPGSDEVFPLYDADDNGSISATERADKNVPDIFVELDWMNGRRPASAAIRNVERAFSTPPARSTRKPVRLHVVVASDPIPHARRISLSGCGSSCPSDTVNFDDRKSQYFGTPHEREHNLTDAKALAFHYGIWADYAYDRGQDSGTATRDLAGSSGQAEIVGNDFVITLGKFAGTLDEQAGTLMHELGHNLGLLHGGADSVPCKPNYFSVMSYSRQFASSYGTNRRLDYSDTKYTTLDETSISEPDGILNGPLNTLTAHGYTSGGKVRSRVSYTSGPIDWNFTGSYSIDGGRVSADVNRLPAPCNGSSTKQQLVGHDDWSNLVYDFRAGNDYADGVHSTADDVEEIDYDEVAPLAQQDTDGDSVNDLIDNCTTVSNADQVDANSSGFGDTCEPNDPTVVLPPTITSPANGSVARSAVVTGTGSPGSVVTASIAGVPGCQTMTAPDGGYVCAVTLPARPGGYALSVTQSVAGYGSSTASSITLVRPKGASSIAVLRKTKKIRKKTRATITVAVRSETTTSGQVRITYRGKVVGRAYLKNGVAKIKLKKFTKTGKKKLVISYSGSEFSDPVARHFTVKVRKK